MRVNIWIVLFCFSAAVWTACSKKEGIPGALNPSSSGLLTRYDLATADYDVLPVTTFVLSYDSGNKVTNVFEKSGQTLSSFALSYTGSRLSGVTDNALGAQAFSYDGNGRLAEVDYTTITDTGKRVYTYDGSGLLIAVLDSVVKPLQLPAITQWLYTYDAGRNNVVQITQNSVDLEGRPTLAGYSFYTFDDKPNPFTAYPWIRDVNLLPGNIPALVNKNNILQSRIVGTVYHSSGGGNVGKFDTIVNYLSGRNYTYNSKGYPITSSEVFQDLQYNYSGNRSYTYDY